MPPHDAILIETQARNTGENVSLTRELPAGHGVAVSWALVICRPYQQRRAYATFKTMWPNIDVTCASRPLPLTDYIATIGDPGFVIHMIVGDTQRVIEYPRAGFAAEEEVPPSFHDAMRASYSRASPPAPSAGPPGDNADRPAPGWEP